MGSIGGKLPLLLLVWPLSGAAGSSGGFPAPAATRERPLMLALRVLGGGAEGKGASILTGLRQMRNSRSVLQNLDTLYSATAAVEQAMKEAYEGSPAEQGSGNSSAVDASRRPGNFHGVKSHSYFVAAISAAHPSFPHDSVQSIVASEWYHPGLTAKAVWCTERCGVGERGLPLARRLDANFEAIQREVDRFWGDPAAVAEVKGVGSHTTQFDKLIAGNGTWVDVRLWRGRAFNRRLCERYFRVLCTLVEASPEVWTNPWSHVLLSVLTHGSWVPFHQGHTNGQLTYHLPLRVPTSSGRAELAVVERGGTLADNTAERGSLFSHPEERTVTWTEGQTLVFDDSFTHAVRFRSNDATHVDEARIVLLMRGWHPELAPNEREALREFIRKGGEEYPEGYEMLPVGRAAFHL